MLLFLKVGDEMRPILAFPGEVIDTDPAFISVSGMMDLTGDEEQLRHALGTMTVKEILRVLSRLHFGQLPRNPKKDILINTFVLHLPDILDNASAIHQRLLRGGSTGTVATSPAQASTQATTTPFSGAGYKLSADKEEDTKKDTDTEQEMSREPKMKLVVRKDNVPIVIDVYAGDTATTVIEGIMTMFFEKMSIKDDPLRASMAWRMVKARDGTVLDEFTPLTSYFDLCWGEVRMEKRDGKHTEISKHFMASGFLWCMMETNEPRTLTDNMYLNEKPSDSTGILCIKVGDSTKLFYHYNSQDTVANIHVALKEKLNIKCEGEQSDFRLKYCTSGSYLLPWEPVEATMKGSDLCELAISLRGGGKSAKKLNLKKSLVADKKEALQAQAQSSDITMIDTIGATVENAKRSLTTMFDNADTDALAVLNQMLMNVPSEVLGNSKDNSPLLEMLSKGRREYRLGEVGDAVMKANFTRLYDLHAEVGGLTETCELTWDVIVNQTFMKDEGSFDWAGFRRLIEDAIVIRASREN